ncbi:hypothetical protein GV792_07250 [Nocardia cyriacigeorgica]|uniref:hypothetical protein n=1 Tax=Nocardia cyriacigeorgica TaxID=135487 RepID=UPI0013B5BBE4|nr:hypothetical protein [Nocardia cyriacigeorgica]NEW49847.1 hypothetical protein [Nocardia cyriacigeorgica]
MGTDIIAAVEELHTDLATWLGSDAPDSVFDRFAAAQHEAFSMVSTTGETVRRNELMARLRGARNALPGLRIDITELEQLTEESGIIVVRFLESHHHAGQISRRRVSAVLVSPDGQPGVQWLTVHETAVAPD